MTTNRRWQSRTYIGDVINGWRLEEEVAPLPHDPDNAMDKFRSRQFRAVHLGTGLTRIRRLHSIFARPSKMFSEYARFNNRVGEVIGSYTIVEFANDRLMIDTPHTQHLWRAVCSETNDEVVLPYRKLISYVNKRRNSTI